MHVIVVPNWALSIMTRLRVTMSSIASSSRSKELLCCFVPLSVTLNHSRPPMMDANPYLGHAFVELYPHWLNKHAVPKCNHSPFLDPV